MLPKIQGSSVFARTSDLNSNTDDHNIPALPQIPAKYIATCQQSPVDKHRGFVNKRSCSKVWINASPAQVVCFSLESGIQSIEPIKRQLNSKSAQLAIKPSAQEAEPVKMCRSESIYMPTTDMCIEDPRVSLQSTPDSEYARSIGIMESCRPPSPQSRSSLLELRMRRVHSWLFNYP